MKTMVADYAEGRAMVGAQVVPVGVPVIIHLETGEVVWQGFPVPPWQIGLAHAQVRQVHDAMKVFWPEAWEQIDWWDEPQSTLWVPEGAGKLVVP